MSKGVLNITKKEHELMKAQGIDDESLLKPGKYKLRRRANVANPKDISDSNMRVEITLDLGLDIVKQLQAEIDSDDPEALKKLIEEKLSQSVKITKKAKAVEKSILSDKEFIAALAREVKKAA